MTQSYYVYLLTSSRRGTLYVGVTNDLLKRVWQHKQGLVEGFSKRYRIRTLVWYEQTDSIESAIVREKQIKKWNRAWKIELIEANNPDWKDLYKDVAT
ncbi:MAG: GIY-YIG nuclease family protein [Burkholderiales bacterium]|nr:GIY-YIG nuclease family protein [Burkholderiales bacterium]